MLEKVATNENKMKIEALNIPKTWAWNLYNTSRIKVASLDKTKQTDLNGFDLVSAIEKNPENLFVKVFAIKANEVNDNGDCFSESELKRAAHTFVGVPVFVNHQNDNVENARGKVVHSWYDDDAKGIYCINMVDRDAYPRLARGIEEGYITGTSMGAQVGFSICSICHNKAHTADEFCSHIKNGKNRKVSGKFECKYHDSSCKPEDDCPLDGKKKAESKELLHKEAKVYEWNHDIKFIEDSFVVNPACHDCLVCDILNLENVQSSVAMKAEKVRKAASAFSSSFANMPEGSLIKAAGKAELDALTQAMNLMEHVARSMMAQKQQVQMDYVSDLVEQLAKVQSLTDELVEMGYAQLPSPPDQQIALGNMMSSSPMGQSQQVMNPAQMGGQSTQNPQPAQSLSKPSTPSSASLGEIGNVTRPTFTGASEENKKDFLKQAENISTELQTASSALRNSLIILATRRDDVAKSETVAEHSNGNLRITVANTEENGLVVGKWKDNKLVSWASAEEFGDEIMNLLASNPQEAAKTILSQYQKESGITMAANNTKLASGNTSQTEVTTQKQLDDAGPLHPRENKAPEVTTQAQIGGDGELKAIKDTSAPLSNQLRHDDIREVTTQGQLDSIKDNYVVRWGEFPEVITQAQWTEMSRRVSTSLGDDYTEQTTQAQLKSLQESHKWTPVEVTTQKQLDDQKSVSPEGKSDSARWASSAKNLVKAASGAIADAIANYGLTPVEVAQAVRQITASPQATIKASYLTLVNAMPSKIEARVAERNRRNYFSKVANKNEILKPVDAMLSALGDNIGYLKAEDFIDAVRFVANDKKAFASAESNAHIKLAARSEDNTVIVDKDDMYRQAFAEIERPEDGLYKLCGTLTEDVKVDPSNKSEFMKALVSFAQQHISTPFIISNVKLDKEAGIFEAECKEEGVCSETEKKTFASAVASNFKSANDVPATKTASRSKNRQELIKSAQMMGGQMGGGMGGGGAQGGAGGMMGGADPAGGMGGMPPAEQLGGQPGDMGGGEDDMMGGDESDMQPKPPGTLCGICGSSDVDVLDGKNKCNNCGAEAEYKLEVTYTKVPGLLDSGEKENDDGLGMGGDEEEGGGEGFAMPDAAQQQSIPVAATVRLNPEMIKKASEDFKAMGKVWSIGAVSPYTGSTDVMKVSDNGFVCLDTGNSYEVHAAGVERNGKKAIFAEWRYDAKPLFPSCPGCRRQKSAFVSALKTHGLSEDIFDSMPLADKGKTILAMQSKGLFNKIKTASKNTSILANLKKSANVGNKFPTEICREKIARIYGENALALSGPCEGNNLADCVCKKLATAGVYSNDIAIKVASIWSKEDQIVECVEDFVRSGLAMKKACFVCDQIKAKYAQYDDMVADEVGAESNDPSPTPGGDESSPSSLDEGGDDFGGVDPFENNGEEQVMGDEGADPSANPTDSVGLGGAAPAGPSAPQTITLELPLNVLEHFEKAVDTAKGGDVGSGMPPAGGSPAGLPGALEGLDQAADSALDAAVGVAEGLGGAVQGEEVSIKSGPGGSVDGAAVAVENAVDEAPGATDQDPVALEKEVPSEGGEDAESSNPFDSESKDENVGENVEEKKESSGEPSNNTDDEASRQEEFAMAQADASTKAFKRGKISSTGEINLDLSSVMKVLAKQKTASEVKTDPAQNDSDIGKYQGDSTMGHEEKFDAKKPEAFTGDATMGHEEKFDAKKPSFDSGGAEMGDEAAQGYKAEKQDHATGGDKGAGTSKAASSRGHVNNLANRILDIANRKTASEKKVEEAKPVSEQTNVIDYSNNKDNPKSGNPIKPFEESDKDFGKVEQGDGSFMGHEKETLVSVPKADNSAPSIPAGGGTNPKYDNNKKNAPEEQTARKGTVIAGGNVESLAARKEAATRIAGRKLKAGMIEVGGLSPEIEKLSRYEVSDLKDIETALFGASKKGLDTVAKGSEKALVISEKSNQRKTASEELKSSIQGLFTLDKKNIMAQDDPTTEWKKFK